MIASPKNTEYTGGLLRIGLYVYHGYALAAKLPTQQVGGMELQMLELGRALRDRGHEVTVFTGDDGQQEAHTIDGLRFRKLLGPSGESLFARLRRFATTVISERCDLILERGSSGISGMLCGLSHLTGIPYVLSAASNFNCMRTEDDPSVSGFRARRLYWYAVRHADAMVVQTDVQRRLLRQHFGKEGQVIRNIPLGGSTTPKRAGGGAVVWIASLHRHKQPEMALRIAAQLPDIRFILVGGTRDASFAASLRQAATAVPNVELRDAIPLEHVHDVLGEARVFLNTTIPGSEGFPNTFIQAWQLGVPVVSLATDPDGLLKEHEAGFCSGSESAIVNDIQKLFSNDTLHELMSSHGQRLFAEYFNRDAIVTSYIELFHNVCAVRPRRRPQLREEA